MGVLLNLFFQVATGVYQLKNYQFKVARLDFEEVVI